MTTRVLYRVLEFESEELFEECWSDFKAHVSEITNGEAAVEPIAGKGAGSVPPAQTKPKSAVKAKGKTTGAGGSDPAQDAKKTAATEAKKVFEKMWAEVSIACDTTRGFYWS